MKKKSIEDYKYISYECGDDIEVVFFTAENGLTFNRRTEKGQENLNKIKKWFNVEKIVYLNQIHSAIVHIFENNKEVINSEGDGIITSNTNTAIGVFTADCVPVILVDKAKRIISAVHSGWRGTYDNIVGKTVNMMKETYNCNPEEMKIYIGPHNRECCYEVSEELIHKFNTNPLFKGKISQGRMLSLEKCIKIELLNENVKEENINFTRQCTFCSKDLTFFSYRREEEKEGRMYSFVYMK
ncbi:peptidoglycan editing factor PgeF [Clostridium sp.]|uniref:peptidoglycan editing factor PgeF n=1 Tax=Clostridium sp. TaxID=1506 RepID=UPI002FCB12A3